MRLFCDAVNLYFSENPDTLGSSELKELRKQADKFHMLDSFPIDSLPGGIKEDILDAHTKTDYGRTKAEFIYRRIIEYAIEKNWSVKEHTLTPGEAAVLQLEHPEYLFSKNLSELSRPEGSAAPTLAMILLLMARRRKAEVKSPQVFRHWLERVKILKRDFNIPMTEICRDSGYLLLRTYPEAHRQKIIQIVAEAISVYTARASFACREVI